MVGTCCISFDHRDQGLRVGERLADLRPRRRRAVVHQVGELGPVWKSTIARPRRKLASSARFRELLAEGLRASHRALLGHDGLG